MKKQRRQILILVVLLVLAAGGYFGLKMNNQHITEKAEKEKEANQVYIMNIEKDAIQKVSYYYDGINYTFQKDGDTWIYPADTTIDIDESALDLIAESGASMVANEKIEGVTDLGQYGLSEPVNTIQIATADKTYTIKVGDYNTTISKYYVATDDSSVVYTVAFSEVSAFQKSLEELTVVPSETETAIE